MREYILKEVKIKDKPVNTDILFCREFINKHIDRNKTPVINWPMELKACKILLKRRPMMFWASLELPFKLRSIWWLVGQDGIRHVNKMNFEFKKDNNE